MTNAFLQLDGVQGDATQRPYFGWIPLESVSTSTGRSIVGGTGSAPPGALSEITVFVRTGRHSPRIAQLAVDGKIVNAEIAFSNPSSSITSIKLVNAVVSSFRMSGDAGSGFPTEEFTLLSPKITFAYQDAKTAAGKQLIGRWIVSIGKWSGYFVFESGGAVHWTELNQQKRNPGKWTATATDIQWKFSSPGDIRTFVVPLEIPSGPVSGRILPAGQGSFSMRKA